VNVVYRPDDSRHWDFPSVIEAYGKLPTPPLMLGK
jgi:hypothetical protein